VRVRRYMNEIAMRDVFGDYLIDLGKRFNNLVVLDCDLSNSTRTYKFAKEIPDRFFNLGIAEQNMLGTALGFAISGKTPIVCGFSIFTTGRAWEFIRMACHDNLNVKIITTHGGIVGEDGSTHHALEDLSLMSSLSNLTILVPADNNELLQMLETAININGPFYIRIPRAKFPRIHKDDYKFSIGKLDILKDGEDICLIGAGYGSVLSYQYASMIEKKLNISIKVINLSTIKPIDEKKLIKEVQNLKGIVVIEEHNIYCGIGGIVARILSNYNPIPMKFIGINNSFCESGKKEDLLEAYGLNFENIVQMVNKLLKKKFK